MIRSWWWCRAATGAPDARGRCWATTAEHCPITGGQPPNAQNKPGMLLFHIPASSCLTPIYAPDGLFLSYSCSNCILHSSDTLLALSILCHRPTRSLSACVTHQPLTRGHTSYRTQQCLPRQHLPRLGRFDEHRSDRLSGGRPRGPCSRGRRANSLSHQEELGQGLALKAWRTNPSSTATTAQKTRSQYQ